MRRRGRPPREPRARPHPFACPSDRLREVAMAAAATPLVEGLVDKAEAGELALLLPSLASGPLASPELVHDPAEALAETGADASGQRVALVPWRVPALRLDARSGLELLLHLPAPGAMAPGSVPPGASLRFLGELAWFVLDLVGRGRVLPGLAGEGERLAARWRPVVTGHDAERLRALATAMPPACRAEQTGMALEGRRSAALLGGVLDALADAATRRALAGVAATVGARPGGSATWPSLPPRRGRRGAAADLAVEAWLEALASDDGRFDANAAHLAGLREALDAWLRSASAAAGPLRTCFRLVEPPEDQPKRRWRLEFLLQASDEPSLLVPAAEVWRAAGTLNTLARRVEQPQELLLTDLGRAIRLYPELERALRSARPAALALDAAGAHRFLRDAAPLLAQTGFGVLLPSWWDRRGARVGLRLVAGSAAAPGAVAKPGGLNLDTLVDYRWELALGDERLTAEELEELARLKVPLVRLRGRWVELDPDRLARGLAFLEQHADGAMPAADALAAGLGLGACLADDMGLGKTIQLL